MPPSTFSPRPIAAPIVADVTAMTRNPSSTTTVSEVVAGSTAAKERAISETPQPRKAAQAEIIAL